MQVRPRHVRHRTRDRLRHSDQFNGWIEAQAARLEKTPDEIFDLLLAGGTYEDIEGTAAPEPEPDPEQ